MAAIEYESPRRKTPLQNYDFCYGMGANYVDTEPPCTTYFIQEYKEAIESGIKPPGIRWVNVNGEEGYITPYQLKEKMKDPEPDPKYAPETPAEHRRNL